MTISTAPPAAAMPYLPAAVASNVVGDGGVARVGVHDDLAGEACDGQPIGAFALAVRQDQRLERPVAPDAEDVLAFLEWPAVGLPELALLDRRVPVVRPVADHRLL